jgi:hypothetical protein
MGADVLVDPAGEFFHLVGQLLDAVGQQPEREDGRASGVGKNRRPPGSRARRHGRSPRSCAPGRRLPETELGGVPTDGSAPPEFLARLPKRLGAASAMLPGGEAPAGSPP